MESMDDILSEKPKEEAPVEAPQQEVEKPSSVRREYQKREWAAQGRDPETGQYVPKEKPEAPKEEAKPKEEPKPVERPAPPKQEFTEKERAFLRAAESERAKRQELEKRLAELEKKPQEPPKPFWDDPEGSLGKLKTEIEEAKQTARLEGSKTLIRVTEAIARGKYSDFDEKIAAFIELTHTNPALHAQFLQASDPAEFAYKTAKGMKDVQDAGGIEELRKKIEIEVRQKLEAELKEREAKIKEERSKLPPSLTDARSVAPANKPVWSGPTPMTDILGGR